MVERLLSAQGLMKPRVFLKSASTDASSNSGVFDDDPDAPAESPDPTDPPTVAPGLVQFFVTSHFPNYPPILKFCSSFF